MRKFAGEVDVNYNNAGNFVLRDINNFDVNIEVCNTGMQKWNMYDEGFHLRIYDSYGNKLINSVQLPNL